MSRTEARVHFPHLCDEGGHGVHARARGVVHERAVLEVDSHLPLVHLQFDPELNDFILYFAYSCLFVVLQVPLRFVVMSIGFF